MSNGDLFRRMLGNDLSIEEQNRLVLNHGPIAQASEQIAKIKAEREDPEKVKLQLTESDKEFLKDLKVGA